VTVRDDVTVLIAVRNSLDAVRLTLRSLFRHTDPLPRVLVAENGSTDGTAQWLASCTWVETVTLEARRASSPRGIGDLAQHAAALDELTTRVRTPWFLTVDSDVEFLAGGWLDALLRHAPGLCAIGEFEDGWGNVAPRLAPYLLLVRTDAFRAIGGSFRGKAVIHDPEAAARFQEGGRTGAYRLTPEEAAAFGTARFYSTAAVLFEQLSEAGLPWAATPSTVLASYRHLGHMSWAQGHADLREQHRRRLSYARLRLAALDEV
jgi:hypothetical protein